jgi:hypothetical protein
LHTQIDILENEILEQYPDVLDILLRDHTTQKNILWATNNYDYLGESFGSVKEITSKSITGSNGNVIMPRVQKDKTLQQSRSRDMAEVFTPSWICNSQNNLIDNSWFLKENVFNKEIKLSDGSWNWKVNPKKIVFPKNKTWKDYIGDKRLEIACGEAPYITSRYDTTTGEFIHVNERIGILDRKLRVINENVDSSGEWLRAAQTAFKSTYAYEWQGDNLLLAREAMLFTFIENYTLKFGKEPLVKSIKYIAYIISWNVWQMDGIKGVIPNSCVDKNNVFKNIFGKNEINIIKCIGCEKDNIKKHTGIYCLVKDWSTKDKITGRAGKRIKFIDLINN